MRKWSYLSAPVTYNNKQIHKVMVYETVNEGLMFFFIAEKLPK